MQEAFIFLQLDCQYHPSISATVPPQNGGIGQNCKRKDKKEKIVFTNIFYERIGRGMLSKARKQIYTLLYETKYSRMDQVTFVEDSLYKN